MSTAHSGYTYKATYPVLGVWAYQCASGFSFLTFSMDKHSSNVTLTVPAGTRATVTISPPRPPSSSLRSRLPKETAALLEVCLLDEVYVRLHQYLDPWSRDCLHFDDESCKWLLTKDYVLRPHEGALSVHVI